VSTDLNDDQRAEFEALLDYIKRNRGFDFTGYKRPTLIRRISKRVAAVNLESFADYADYLEAQPDEFTALFDTILINVTSFFRDPESWEYLASSVIPQIVEEKAPGDGIRIWSTGCATGEEAYTIAMLFAEHLGDEALRERVKIYATDLDETALSVGRHGRYPTDAIEPIPQNLRDKYLELLDGHYIFRSDIRRAVIFGRHNLLTDPPISRVDLLSARNTLMYFGPETQSRVLASFHFSLNPKGFLFLGKSEVLLTRSNLFVPHDLKRRVFQPTPKVPFRDRLADLAHGRSEVPADETPVETTSVLREAVFDTSPGATLILDLDGNLVLANLQARSLFSVSKKDVGRAFHELEISYRPLELRSRIEEAKEARHPVTIRDVELQMHSGETRFLDFHVTPLVGNDGAPSGIAITAVDITRYRALQDSIERSRTDLETAYEELQATTEELETTNEELQSTNEELETTNEELQSTNEELETMNEELQSTNEELETMNDELRLRTDDLNSVNSFLDSVLTSLHSGVVVLDRELRVQAWNAAAEDLWGLRADEAEGQHFLNLDIGLPVNELSRPLRDALSDGGRMELELDATNRRGRAVRTQVRIAPMDGSAMGTGLIVLMEANDGVA
jgi:two-component system, chemotaxis family, CheB/CheR fusion protein